MCSLSFRYFPAFVPERIDSHFVLCSIVSQTTVTIPAPPRCERDGYKNRCESWFIMRIAPVITIVFDKWWWRRQWGIAQHFLNHFLLSWSAESPFLVVPLFFFKAPQRGKIIRLCHHSIFLLTVLWPAQTESSDWFVLIEAAFVKLDFLHLVSVYNSIHTVSGRDDIDICLFTFLYI